VDHDKVRETLNAQIDDLVTARSQSQDPQEKAAASAAIARLENEVNQLNLTIAAGLPAKVNAIVAELQKVLDAHSLDAVSALGRSIKKIKALKEEG
jgi:hypothetical protein